jgi:hypothetical protein
MSDSFSKSTPDESTKGRVLDVLTDLVEGLEDLTKARPAIFAHWATLAVGATSSEGLNVGGVFRSGEALVRNVCVDCLVGRVSWNDLVAVDALSGTEI